MRFFFHGHFFRHFLRLLTLLAASFCFHYYPHDSPPLMMVSADAAFIQRHSYPLQTLSRSRDLVAGRGTRIRRSKSSYCRFSLRPNVADTTASSSTILQNTPKSRLGRRLIPPRVLEELASSDVQFPYTCELFPNYDVPRKSLFWKPPKQQQQRQQNSEESSVNNTNNKNNAIIMTIRLLQANDIRTVTDMCCQEYGVGNGALNLSKTLTTAIQNADFKAFNRLAQDLLEEFVLRLHVDWTMRLKVPPPISVLQKSAMTTRIPSSNGTIAFQQQPPPRDHAVLLLTLSDSYYYKSQQETVVGIVEVSRQPPIPERNPPAFPIPLVVKELYCWWWSVSQQLKKQLRQQTFIASKSGDKKPVLTPQRVVNMNRNMIKPEGWITNVLVAPEFRGQGWAKVLVHACEGVARSWHVPAIHLHCDANGISGRVAQKLYTSMGYQDSGLVNGDNEKESSSSLSSSEYDWLKLAALADAAASGFSSSSSSSSTDASFMFPTVEPVLCSSSVHVIEGVPLLYLKKDLV